MPPPHSYQRPGSSQGQSLSLLQHHQHAENTEYPSIPELEATVQPKKTGQSDSSHGPAEDNNPRARQPQPTDLIQSVEVGTETSGGFELDVSVAIWQQELIMQEIYDSSLGQREDLRTGGGGGDLSTFNVVANATDATQIEANPLVERETRGPFGIVVRRTAGGAVVKGFPFTSPDERVMKDNSGILVLNRPVRP
ncbi:uncharacterized protein PV07_11664 [Cladophialophora immunda]|uniref:Uncharacterized protein n=1 Tax=Cladophialophora immunda TaxID=569365 RepID=A0A0D2BYS0_9EURO|nr:uncharacterized protein PV07_11664 [Cladophialophora immunda]KIW23470.1 hypothetical protein PV07_11664 [Cladophialophora immunda]